MTKVQRYTAIIGQQSARYA